MTKLNDHKAHLALICFLLSPCRSSGFPTPFTSTTPFLSRSLNLSRLACRLFIISMDSSRWRSKRGTHCQISSIHRCLGLLDHLLRILVCNLHLLQHLGHHGHAVLSILLVHCLAGRGRSDPLPLLFLRVLPGNPIQKPLGEVLEVLPGVGKYPLKPAQLLEFSDQSNPAILTTPSHRSTSSAAKAQALRYHAKAKVALGSFSSKLESRKKRLQIQLDIYTTTQL